MTAVQGDLSLTPEAYDGELATTLIAELQHEYVLRYGGPDETPVDARQFTPPDGVYLVARVGETVIGSVALRRHDTAPSGGDGGVTVEMKRLYVREAHRGHGYGRAILDAVEQYAHSAGYQRLVLETGNRQPEAIGLYVSTGYTSIPGFGVYACSPNSRYFGLDLPR